MWENRVGMDVTRCFFNGGTERVCGTTALLGEVRESRWLVTGNGDVFHGEIETGVIRPGRRPRAVRAIH